MFLLNGAGLRVQWSFSSVITAGGSQGIYVIKQFVHFFAPTVI